MSIATRTLKAGMRLVATYKGKQHTAEVVKTADGLRFFVDGAKTEFKTISGAGKSIHGSRSIGGYGFWSLADSGTAKKSPAKKTNASLATDKEMAAEVALAGGKKAVAKAVAAAPTGTTKRSHKKASTKEVA